MIVVPASAGSAATRAATSKPSRSGICASSSTSWNGVPPRRGGRERLNRGLAAVHRDRLHAPAQQLAFEDAAVDRVVVDDQRADVGEPCRAIRDVRAGRKRERRA